MSPQCSPRTVRSGQKNKSGHREYLDDLRRSGTRPPPWRLRGELLRDWCRQLAEADESVEFKDAWCSGQRTIRLYASTLDALVNGWRGAGDCWGLGRLAFYEIKSALDDVTLLLTVSIKGMRDAAHKNLEKLIDADCNDELWLSDSMTLRSWPIVSGDFTANDAVDGLATVWNEQVVPFERSVIARLSGPKKPSSRRGRSDVPQKKTPAEHEAVLDVDLIEGAEYATLANRFERNRHARELCIQAHGAVCAVCGFDSGKVYGGGFEGIIDVHHRIPLSEIRDDYTVDPVNDLVPLCPNCHRAIHSKPGGGAYTVEELHSLFR